jgi:DNA-binding MarR family transcriptional regulator
MSGRREKMPKLQGVVLQLLLLNARVSSFTDALCVRHGLPSTAAYSVLSILAAAGDSLPPSTIARQMYVSRPTMSGIVGSLTKRRFVRVVAHPTDRRMLLVEITDAGHRIAKKLRPELAAIERRWLSHIAARDRQTLLRLVEALHEHAPGAG